MLIDDHPIVRMGVAEAFKACDDMEISHQAGLIVEANHYLKTEHPDAIILDLSLKDQSGLEFLKDLQAQNNKTPVLVLSVNNEDLFAERSIQAGARGYLSKSASVQEMINAVRRIMGGEIVVSPRIASQLVNRMGISTKRNTDTAIDKMKALSDREIKVFQMLGNGMSNKQIGGILKISVKTVDTHRKHIMEKIGYANSQEMIRHAILWANETKG